MEEKKESYNGIVIFLIVLGIVAVTGTIFYANKIKTEASSANKLTENIISDEKGEKREDEALNMDNVSDEEEIDYQKLVEEDKKYIIKSGETYFTNNIELIKEKYTSGEVVFIDEDSKEKTYEENVTYYQIDGLKDEKIEKEINERLKKEAFKILDEDTTHAIKSSTMSIEGNFSNILSLTISSSQYNEYRWEEDAKNTYEYINIDLTTGNDIKLQDIFVKGTSFKTLIRDYFYELVQNYESEPINIQFRDGSVTTMDYVYYSSHINELGMSQEENYKRGYVFDENGEKIEYLEEGEWESLYIRSNFEDITFKYLRDFDNLEFSISPGDDINLHFKGLSDRLPPLPRLDIDNENLAIYKRFVKDESIFTDEYNNSIIHKYKEPLPYGFVLDNLFLDFYDYTAMEEYEGIVNEEYKKNINEKIEAEKEYARQSKDKVIFLGIYYGVEDSYSCERLEIQKKTYEENKRKILKDIIFQEFGGVNFCYVAGNLETNYIHSKCNSDYFSNEYGYQEWHFDNQCLLDTNTRKIESSEIKSISSNELELIYNEIFARHGHDFQTKSFREHFGSCIWYKPIYKKTVSLDELSDIERANVQTIKDEMARRK